MNRSPNELFAEALLEATKNPTFKPLNKTQKLDIEHALEMGAAHHLSQVWGETVEVMTDPAKFKSRLSRKYATEAIETMLLASPGAQLACLGVNAVSEAADRLAAEMFIPVACETGVALLNHGFDANDLRIEASGLNVAAPAYQLAGAAGVSVLEIVADAWLRARGHEWAKPGAPHRTTHTAQ